VSDVLAPPAGLAGEALERWHVVAPTLVARGPVDVTLLQTYCQVWARWREAEAHIAKIGSLIRNASGNMAANPLIAISNQAGAQVRALEERLGIGIDKAKAAGPLSLRAYAKRRGCSVEAVSRAIKAGRLVASVVTVDGSPKIADADLADQEWDANTDHSKAPPASDGDMDGAAAAARERHWKALTAELNYRRQAGELVEAAAAEERWLALIATAQTKLLAIGSRMKQRLPHLTISDIATIDDFVRESLEELADGR
jgi:P27 family predicted phage terminase small subunit